MTSRWSPRARAAVVCLVVLSSAGPVSGSKRAQPAATADGDASLKGFRAAIDGYVGLRTRIASEVPPLRVTADAQEIARTSDAIARAVTRARRNARSGQFFDAAAAAGIRKRLAAALASTDEVGIRALLEEDMTTFRDVRVHSRYPVGFTLPTMPATLLQALPVLPPQLEYRFIGRALILRDVDAALIVDYLPDALPPG
jgi:hypothetical protein